MNQNSTKILSDQEIKRTASRVSGVSIAGNILLSLLKVIAGVVGHSGAMISDAVHSASDVLGTLIALLGIHISQKKADRNHQYGHDRLECISAVILAMILLTTGMGIGINGIKQIMTNESGADAVPGLIALVTAAVSIVCKEWMYWYTRAAAKKIQSGALMAEAWHHRSDALSSIGAFAGILGARMGYPVLDPLASIIICIFIVKAAVNIFRDAADRMIDKSCDEETEAQMKEVILRQKGVLQLDLLHTRLFGARIYVDIEISADGTLSLESGHNIAEHVHKAIESEFPLVKHCMVHVNPM